jgi:hypothetical protein
VGPLSRLPLHPLLLAAYAVLFVYAANVGEVLPEQTIDPLLAAVAASAVVLLLCALLFRDLRRGALLASAIVIAFAFFGHLADQITVLAVPEPYQLIAWAAFVLIAALYALRARGSLPTVTAAANGFAFALVLMTLVTILPAESNRVVHASEGEPVSDTTLGLPTRNPDRDIYFLIFDRYGSEWSLEHSFGVHSDLTGFLEDSGFQVIPGARANYHSSDFSIATMLNLDYITDLVHVDPPSTDRRPVRERLARHEVGRFMRANGYRYIHLGAWWEPTRDSPIADEVLALGKTTELQSVLYEASVMPTIDGLLQLDRGDTHSRDQHRDQALFAFRQVERLAHTPGRKFVFAHILMPHPPYVLAEDGRVVYAAEAKAKSEAQLLQAQLDYTDDRIRELVAALLAGPDESDPIIIITGDEGPYLCYEVDCVDGSARALGIRLGVLRAYYLPGLDYTVPPDDSGVNIFRMILREYFGLDLPDLPNRSYTWPDPDVDRYTLTDITDDLPLPGGRSDAGA